MEPTYHGYDKTNSTVDIFNGDFIILQKRSAHIGDVILFKPVNSNKLYLHRVVAEGIINGQVYYLTKGDSNRYTDISPIGDTNFGWIPKSNVFGVAIFTIHSIGWFVDQLTTPTFIISSLGAVVLLILAYVLYNKQIREKIKELGLGRQKTFYLTIKTRRIKLTTKKMTKLFLLSSILLLSFTFVSLELANAAFNPINIELLSTDDSPLPPSIDLSNPHLFDLEPLHYNSQTIYLLDIKLKMSSGGLFNSLQSVKLQLLPVNESYNANNGLYYTWVSSSYFTGTIIVNGALIIPNSMLLTPLTVTLNINVHYTVSHVIFNDNHQFNQSIILK